MEHSPLPAVALQRLKAAQKKKKKSGPLSGAICLPSRHHPVH